MGREAQRECGTGALRAPHTNLAAMVDRDMLDDRKAQPGSAGDPRSSRVDAVEALEDALEVAFGDTNALVSDTDLDNIIAEMDADGDPGVVRAVVDGVAAPEALSRSPPLAKSPGRPRRACSTRMNTA